MKIKAFIISLIALIIPTCYAAEDVIQHTSTRLSDDTPAQVTFNFDVPSAIYDNCFAIMMDSKGKQYKVTASKENSYNDRIYLAYGKYTVLETGVINHSDYRFNVNNDNFTLSEDNKNFTVKCTLSDYITVAKETNSEIPADFEKEEKEFYDTAVNNVHLNPAGEPFFDVENNSAVGATVTISGYADEDYHDLALVITKSGVVGEAEFGLSVDGGKSIYKTYTTADTVENAATGLTFTFTTKKDTDELQKGDIFKADVISFNKVRNSNVEANILLAGAASKKTDCKVTILSSGKRGTVKFEVQLTPKKEKTVTYTDTIPENGVYVKDDITLYFADGEYIKGDFISGTLAEKSEKTNYMPLYIFIGILVLIGFIGTLVLASKKDKKSDYILTPWKDRQNKDVYR